MLQRKKENHSQRKHDFNQRFLDYFVAFRPIFIELQNLEFKEECAKMIIIENRNED